MIGNASKIIYNCFVIDLHVHSNYSDGTLSIEEIIALAKEKGLSQIAITDHNILTGSINASKISDIDFVIGTELSVGYHGSEVHLLGYFPFESNYKNVQFVINEGEAYKKVAILEMIENLNAMGFELDVTELSKYSKGIINRVHICMAMMEHGYISTIKEGFNDYIGDHCEAYVERETVSIREAAKAIHDDGGIAVIAHPYEYEEDLKDIDSFLIDIMPSIDGIECYHPSANGEQSEHLKEIALAHGKIVTGGSDFHGENKPDIDLNMMKVSDKYRIIKNA